MRIASWLLVACCALAALGVFFPAIEAEPALTAHVTRIAHRTSLSLYQAASDRELARRLLAVYRASRGQRVGVQLVSAMELHADGRVHGRAKDTLDDARDAMDALGGISDHDAKTIGIAVAIAIYAFLIILGALALLVLAQAVSGSYGRGKIIVTVILGLLVAAMAIAMGVACKQVVFEVNDEVSYNVVELGRGAWLIPIGGAGVLVTGIALLIAHIRASRR
jgi:GNAT superfamily N-acetyltransferase